MSTRWIASWDRGVADYHACRLSISRRQMVASIPSQLTRSPRPPQLSLKEPELLAYVADNGEALSFPAVREQVCALAASFSKTLHVCRGDRVSVALRNCPEWCISFLSTIVAGGVAVPLNSWWTTEELRYGLRDSGSKVLVCDAMRLQRAAPVLSELSMAAVLIPGERPSVTPSP